MRVSAVAGLALLVSSGLSLATSDAAAEPSPASELLWTLAVVLVLLGLAGTVLPALPSSPLVFVGLLIGAWADDFKRVGWITLVLLGLLAAAAYVLDVWATLHGARRSGASALSTAGATVGALVGLFFSLPGLILGPFIGAFAGELLMRRGLRQAGRAGLGAWLGLLLATAARTAMVLLMIGLFAFSYLLG